MTQAILAQKRRASTQEQIFQILFENDELTWKQIIFGLIESEEMDPWDIDISLISHKFIEMLKTLKQMDFRISGKIVLASAILLKMKSKRLVEEEVAALDQLISSADDPIDMGFFEEFPMDGAILLGDQPFKKAKPKLVPRTPQPRKRKVSVYDLVEALEKALETDAKRVRSIPKLIKEAKVPRDHVDMSALLRAVYDQVNGHYKAESPAVLTFDDLIPSEEKEDKVLTFIPLLHLDFQRKVDVRQKQHFGQINVHLLQPDANFTQAELETK
ncbi:segregation/condensation protein A [Candidatus Woesearchaeota archaeon]|nr:segregation/condensation protein A [Candidatus Woesearchaeota archaeon]